MIVTGVGAILGEGLQIVLYQSRQSAESSVYQTNEEA